MIKKIGVVSILALLSSCASQTKPAENSSAARTESAVAAPARADERPKCLNVSENDRRIEFTGRQLLLSEKGKPKALDLDRGRSVECENLNVLDPSQSVVVIYQTEQRGTSVLVSDRMMGIASIKTGKWQVEPFIVERLFTRAEGDEAVPFHDVKWTVEQGQAVFTWTDLETKKTKTFRPSYDPKKQGAEKK